MSLYEIEYEFTTKEILVLDADDAEQAEQFTKEFFQDTFEPEGSFGFNVIKTKELSN